MLSELLKSLPQVGRVEWIGVAAVARAPMTSLVQAAAGVGTGLDTDHHAKSGKPSARQVTLIQAEHLPVIAALCGRDDAPPGLLRRNIVVSGINLLALKKAQFQIGDAVLKGPARAHRVRGWKRISGPAGTMRPEVTAASRPVF